MRSIGALFLMLRWSLRLDTEFLFRVTGISLFQRLRIIVCKYLFFLRDRLRPARSIRTATVFGLHYLYDDRFGLGSIQRVYCSSWLLKGLFSTRPVVVDVGANLGQFNLFCRHYLDAERVISIEPLPECFHLLKKNAAEESDCINALISDKEVDTRFFVARDSQLSSTVCDRAGDYSEEIMVQGKPLEKILDSVGCERINLLKIDTEGSEIEVLRSAGRYLEKTDVVLVEMSIFRENTGNFFAVGSFLESHGFRLHELIFSAQSHPADADGIFVRI